METEFRNAYGKGIGEVMRDVADFLSTPMIVNEKRGIDLCRLVERLNMHEQFSFALLSEADAQGWDADAAERFYRQAVGGVVSAAVMQSMLDAFHNREGDAYKEYERLYGNRFSMGDDSYWATALALGIDAGRVEDVTRYLRLFIITLMEFAYMEDRNPDATYTWCYYGSFQQILEELTCEPEPAPAPLAVRSLGGTVGSREGDSYLLTLGMDIENSDPNHMARGIRVDITLKDREGRIITVIADQLQSMDPASVYHYGITKRIRGAAVASFSATARASSHLRLSTPVMKHLTVSDARLRRSPDGSRVFLSAASAYDRPLRALTVHYQLLNRDNRILGGGSEWIPTGITPEQPVLLSSELAVTVQGAAKILCSFDFDALELTE